MQFLSRTHFLICIQTLLTFLTATILGPLIDPAHQTSELFLLPMPFPISHLSGSLYTATFPSLCKTFASTGKFYI